MGGWSHRRGGRYPVQSVWDDPQEGQAWQRAVDTQPVGTGWSQSE